MKNPFKSVFAPDTSQGGGVSESMPQAKLNCPACKSTNFYRSGFYKKQQVYQCKDCSRKFTEKSLDFFSRFRFHPRIINYAIQVYYRKQKQFVEIEQLLKERGIIVSSKQVGVWVKKCSELFADQLSNFKIPEYTNPWHLEIDKTAAGHLHTIYDSSGNILSVLLSKEKSIDSIKQSLRDAAREAQFLPDTIVAQATEDVEQAMKELGAKAKNVKHFEIK